MHLKSLELNGFKSFGKKSELSFTSSITSIVGPNGSGKSNIAEAFRFVLGEQSLKSMRGKRGEDLIFNGSGDAARSNRASVKLTFDNTHRLLSLDFDEVSIERVVYRDSQNEYFINGSKVRLKDVSELLSGAHIGASGHHIISQGEADRILHASPKERRDMVEDALGIKIYKYKKEESERKLEKTELNIKEVESLRREIAPHLKFLRKQVEKLEKAEELRKELLEKGQRYFKDEGFVLTKEEKAIASEKIPLQKEFEGLEMALAQARRVVEAGMNGKEAQPEILSLEEKIRSARARKDEVNLSLGQIEGEISFAKRALEREREKARAVEEKPVKLSEVGSLRKKIESIIDSSVEQPSIELLRHALRSIKDSLQEFFKVWQSSENNEEIERLSGELKRLEGERVSISENLKKAGDDEQALVGLLEEKRKELERAKDETKEAEKEVFRIIANQNEIRSQLEKLESRIKTLAVRKEAFQGDLRDISGLIGVEVLKFTHLQLENFDESILSERRKEIERFKIRLEEMGIGGASEVMKEFKETEERDSFLARELEDLFRAKDDLLKLIVELEKRLDAEFKTGVEKINTAFREFFTMMFGGGNAAVKVSKQEKRRRSDEEGEDEEPEIEEGVDIEVALPHKKIKGLMMLSGGERALTSIALLFAISQVNPPPFIILDETDAALDEANSRKYGDMLESLAKHSQLIVITHNRETMSRAGVIYGITMGKDAISKLLSIAFEDAVAVAK